MSLEWNGTLYLFFLDTSLRIAVFAAIVALILMMVRVRSNSMRHAAWTFVLFAMLLMPVLPYCLPSIHIPVPVPIEVMQAEIKGAEAAPPSTAIRSNDVVSAPTREAQYESSIQTERNEWKPSWPLTAIIIYCTGFFILLSRMVLGWQAMSQIARQCTPITLEHVIHPKQRSGMATVYESQQVVAPLTAGILSPRIILPVTWKKWPGAKLRAVLAHEFAHVRRRDPLIAMFSHLNRCIFWFHPLSWWLDRKLAVTAELACDDEVIRAVGENKLYAEVLFEIAQAVRRHGGRLALQSIGLNGNGLIGQRIDRILRGNLFYEISCTRKTIVVLGCATAIFLVGACRQKPLTTALQEDPEWAAQLADQKAQNDFYKAAGAMNPQQVVDSEAPIDERVKGEKEAKTEHILNLRVINKATGEPIPDVGLTILIRRDQREDKEDKTDKDGLCRIVLGEKTPEFFLVEVRKKGFVPMQFLWHQTSSLSEIPDQYTLALESGTTIGGIIQDEQGNPISGASVFMIIPPREGSLERVAILDIELKTDANGIWKCDYVPAKLDEIWIRLAHPDYVNDDRFGQTLKPPMEKLRDMTGVMVMKKGLVVKGRVLDVEGQPIKGASVAQGSNRFGTMYPRTVADAEGNFIFNNARPGEMILTVQASGNAPDLKQILVTEDMAPIEFRLERGYTIKGRIVDPNGKPVAGAFASADTWRGHRSLNWQVDTNADGRFQWRAAPPDNVLIDMGKRNYMSVRRYGITPSDEEYVIIMYPELKVHGSVVDADTGQPVQDFRLLTGIDWGNGQAIYWQRDNVKIFKQGRYEITFSEPHKAHLVRIEAEGYKPGVSLPFQDTDIDVTFDFKLEKEIGP